MTQRNTRPKVAVVGGGISGLSAAYRLHQLRPDIEVVLFEASAQVGGKVRTQHAGDCLIEAGADSFLSRKQAGVQLCEALGLADDLIGRTPTPHKTQILSNGCFHDLPEGLTGLVPTHLEALHNSTLLSPSAIERIGQERTIPPKLDDADESLRDFVTRRFGAETYTNLMQPLMGGIYSSDGADLSIRATFPQLRALEHKHGSILAGLEAQAKTRQTQAAAYPPFVALRGGMGQLTAALAAALPEGTVRLNQAITAIRAMKAGYTLHIADVVCDVAAVIVATEAGISAEITHLLDRKLSQQLGTIPYGSTDIVTLVYRTTDLPELPRGYGFLVAQNEQRAVRACSYSSNKWVGRGLDDVAIMRFFASAGVDIAQVKTEIMQGLLGVSAEPLHTYFHQWQNAIPQYTLGHCNRVAAIEATAAAHPRFALTGAYFDGVGIPDCIRRGLDSAEKITNQLN